MDKCQCGTLKLETWPTCGKSRCVQSNLDTGKRFSADRAMRTWRFRAIRQVLDTGYEAASERQRNALMAERTIRRGLTDEVARRTYDTMRHEDT